MSFAKIFTFIKKPNKTKVYSATKPEDENKKNVLIANTFEMSEDLKPKANQSLTFQSVQFTQVATKEKIDVLRADEEALLQGGLMDLNLAVLNVKSGQGSPPTKDSGTDSLQALTSSIDSGVSSNRKPSKVSFLENIKSATAETEVSAKTVSFKTIATTIKSDAFGQDELVAEFRWSDSPTFSVPIELQTSFTWYFIN